MKLLTTRLYTSALDGEGWTQCLSLARNTRFSEPALRAGRDERVSYAVVGKMMGKGKKKILSE